jgi:pimeloyl-ACP methyl ester carboxylesterase
MLRDHTADAIHNSENEIAGCSRFRKNTFTRFIIINLSLSMPITSDTYYFAHRADQRHLRPLVLIHGAGGSHLYWPAKVRRLKNCRVYALDLPGHGKSKGRGQQTIAAYADHILGWMDAVGLEKALFVGHSMGGAIALHLGLHHPQRVYGLALLSTGARLSVSPEILTLTSHRRTFPAAVQMIVSWAFGSQADPRLVELASQRMIETRSTVLNADFVACNAFNEISALPQIDLPTLVLCGQDDRLTPPRSSQFLADQIASAELKMIPDAGHMVMLEKPEAVAAALAEFSDSLGNP